MNISVKNFYLWFVYNGLKDNRKRNYTMDTVILLKYINSILKDNNSKVIVKINERNVIVYKAFAIFNRLKYEPVEEDN